MREFTTCVILVLINVLVLMVSQVEGGVHGSTNTMEIFEHPATVSQAEAQILLQLASVTVGNLPAGTPLDFIHCIALLNSRCESAKLPPNCRVRIDSDPQALVDTKYSQTLDKVFDVEKHSARRLAWFGITNSASFREQAANLTLFQWLSLVAGTYGAFYDIGVGGRIYLYPDTYTGGGVPAPKSAGCWPFATNKSDSIETDVFGTDDRVRTRSETAP